ncbi:MAG: tetratricopeptide repeat protein [Kiritimatiellaceae bacterium]|nr:tetratricopeptide repeat protein [Kiritimatiellaceae bacterium]
MKNRKNTIITAGVVLILIMFVGCGKRSGEKEFDKAMQAMKSGKLARAKALFEKSIRKTTSNNEKKSVALNQLGIVHWKLGEISEAADAFNQSCNLTESLTGSNLNLGLALFHAQRYDEAEVALNNVLGENPNNQTALATLGLIEMQKRNWAGASRGLLKSVSANPRSAAAQNALVLADLNKSKNTETAIRKLKQIISAHPRYAPASYNIAVIYDQWLNNKSEATNWYRAYLKLAGSAGSHTVAANNALARLGGQQNTGFRTGSSAENATTLMTEGYKLYQAKKYQAATELYLKAIRIDPKQKDAFYNMSLCYYHLRKWNDAERAAKALKSLNDPRGDQMLNYISTARKK